MGVGFGPAYDAMSEGFELRRFLPIALGMTLTLTGCASGLGGGSTPDTYALSAAPVVTSGSARHRQILIAEPQALKALDSQQIVIRTSGAALQYLADSQWSDRLTKIVQAQLVQAFENTGRVGGVGQPGEGLAIDYQIITTIRAFEVSTAGEDAAVVEISAKLLNDRNGVVRAQSVFRSTSRLSGSSNEAYVAALDRAFGRVTADLVTWALARI